MRNRCVLWLGILSILFGLSTERVSAQDIWGVAAVALAGRELKDIIADFQSVAGRLLEDGRTAGNGIVARMGEEMNVTIQNMGLIVASERRRFFEDLDASERSVLSQMNRTIESINNLAAEVKKTEELAFIDIQTVLNSIPAITHLDFYVSSVRGLTLFDGTTFHELTLTGLVS